MKLALEMMIFPAFELIVAPESITKSLVAKRLIKPLFLATTEPPISIEGAVMVKLPLLDIPVLSTISGISDTKVRLVTEDAETLEIKLFALLKLKAPFFRLNNLSAPLIAPVIVSAPLPPKVVSPLNSSDPDTVEDEVELINAPTPLCPTPVNRMEFPRLCPARSKVAPSLMLISELELPKAVVDPSWSIPLATVVLA